jgi:hypothetical protein
MEVRLFVFGFELELLATGKQARTLESCYDAIRNNAIPWAGGTEIEENKCQFSTTSLSMVLASTWVFPLQLATLFWYLKTVMSPLHSPHW